MLKKEVERDDDLGEKSSRSRVIDYRSVWEFVHAEKLSHKKRR